MTLLNTGVATDIKLTINSFPPQNSPPPNASPTSDQFSDTSQKTAKFPNFRQFPTSNHLLNINVNTTPKELTNIEVSSHITTSTTNDPVYKFLGYFWAITNYNKVSA